MIGKNTYDDKKLKHRIESKFNGGSHSPENDDDLTTMGGNAASSLNSNDGTTIILGAGSSTGTTAVSASPSMIVGSPFGPLNQATSRKTLFFLLATLNAAFPDYDFR